VESISEAFLRQVVETISLPRHFFTEPGQNRWTADWIAGQLASFGYDVFFQGQFRNVVTRPASQISEPLVLIGAHYDSVPNCPGADDNASAVAAMLACAQALARFAPRLPVCCVAFNAEEDGLVGSQDFVEVFLPESGWQIQQVHILEMLGYCSDVPGSQRLPAGLPIRVPDTGNFLGIISNHQSNEVLETLLTRTSAYVPTLPVVGLKLYLGLEKLLPVLGRSDHAPFWNAGIPALMWTDTAEFRNPNYHLRSDTPDTLDYGFLRKSTQLLFAHGLGYASSHSSLS
jgi:Zn-dependent M28 family amino/carboxypeptidase